MVSKKLAREEINRIADKYSLDPIILQNVVWGRAAGLSNKQIAQQYNVNPNTVSKYTRVLRAEMKTEEISATLVAAAALMGVGYLISKLFSDK